MVERRIPRVQEILLPALREALPGVLVTSWIPDVDRRSYPLVSIRKVGGTPVDMDVLDRQTIELQAIGNESLAATEDLFYDARYVIWEMVKNQTVTPAGHLHSFTDSSGAMQLESPYTDTWRIQGLIQLGVRPPTVLGGLTNGNGSE